MWYKIKAKDQSINMVINFSIWADNELNLNKVLSAQKIIDIKILGTTEDWTPEWANSFNLK
ncbi:MAG: hypothetical protein CMB81_05830 [Flammeovirgaceae bacterium]|nr:hypothetical protein [Flammeovirgaceae bacterium]|tara:strand:- start:871 stop:1053 length:183 start_codon:yes stop_codon:yes gene_type:complete